MSVLAWLVWSVVLLSATGMICGFALFAVQKYRTGEGDARTLKVALVCGVVAMVIPALFTGPHSTLPYGP